MTRFFFFAAIFYVGLDRWAPSHLSIVKIAGIALGASLLLSLMSLKPGRRRGARFATAPEEHHFTSAEVPTPRIFLGRGQASGETLFSAAPHVFVFAGTGGGKTVATVIPTLLTSTVAAIVIDPKGEVYRKTAAHRRRLGPTFQVGLTLDQTDDPPFGFDPLEWLAARPGVFEAIVAAELTSGATTGGAKSPFWTDAARQAWTGVLMYAARMRAEAAEDEKPLTFVDCLEFLDDPRRIELLLETDQLTVEERAALRYFSNLPGDTKGGVQATARAALILTPRLTEFLTQRTLRRDQLVGTYTLYLTITPTDIDAQAALFRVLLRLLIEERLINHAVELPPLQVIIDEAAQLGQLSFLPRVAALTRGYGLQFLYIFQGEQQIRSLYGSFETFTLNGGAFLVFKVTDSETAERISKFVGEYEEKKMKTSTTSGSGKSSVSRSENREQARLLLPSEILALPFGKALLIVPPYVIRLDLLPYYENPEMLKQTDGAI